MKQFTASNFIGLCNIDEDFEPYLIKMNELAVKYKITVKINSSYRPDANVKGAIVKPSTRSNHMVGHAIDCNLVFDGKLYNSKLMQADTGAVKEFINAVVKSGLRWGGNFKIHDPVHFDSGLNINNPTLWDIKYNQIHKQ